MDLATTVMLSVLAAVIAFGLFVANNTMKADREALENASRLRAAARESPAGGRTWAG